MCRGSSGGSGLAEFGDGRGGVGQCVSEASEVAAQEVADLCISGRLWGRCVGVNSCYDEGATRPGTDDTEGWGTSGG